MLTRDLQERLNDLGYGPLTVDGIAGPKTLRAVRQFQAAQGLTVDGVAGPNTWGALDATERPERPASAPDVPDTVPGRALGFALADLGAAEGPLGANAGPEISHLVDGYGAHWGIASPARSRAVREPSGNSTQ